MRPRLLHWLRCPRCGDTLSLGVERERRDPSPVPPLDHPFWAEGPGAAPPRTWDETWAREIEEGSLACACGATYPIRAGVPRLLPQGEPGVPHAAASAEQGRTRECYNYLWRFKAERLGWQHQGEHERDLFLRNMAVPAGACHARALLDAGCGDGRFTASLASLGLETVGVDLSEGVEVGQRHSRDPLVHYVQGDLLAPPLRRNAFDFVWSFGVLHHTADVRRAFEQCAVLVRPSGRLFVWLYDRAPDNRATVIRLSQRAPLPVKRLVSRAFQVGNSVKRGLGVGNPVTRQQTRDEVYFWNLDMYGPAHRSLQSSGEVRAWFRQLGFENVAPRERMEFGFGMTGDLPVAPHHPRPA